MKDWTEVESPKGVGGGGQKELKRINWKDGDSWRIRLVGGVLPRYVYWVTTKEGKPRSLECLSFDRDTGRFTNDPDPVKELPEEAFNEKPQFGYVCQGILRRPNGKDELVIIDLKSKMYKQIETYAKDKDYGSPSNPVTGYDLNIKKNKTGPKVMNVEYVVTPSRNSTPLTEEEQALTLYDLDAIMKRPSYDEQLKWLIDNTNYYVTDDSFRPDEVASDV